MSLPKAGEGAARITAYFRLHVLCFAVFRDCVCPNMGARENACYSEEAVHRARDLQSRQEVPSTPSAAVDGEAHSNQFLRRGLTRCCNRPIWPLPFAGLSSYDSP